MKRNLVLSVLMVCVSLTALLVFVTAVAAQGGGNGSANPNRTAISPSAPTAPVTGTFTYQGSLKKDSSALTGSCEMAFRAYDAPSGGAQIGNAVTTTVAVNHGLFTVGLDLGFYVFNGNGRWLDIRVQCPGDAGFTPLSPRQAITPAPYAISLKPGAYIQDADVYGPSFSVENGWPGGFWLVDKKAIQGWTSDGTALWGAAGTGSAVVGYRAATTGTLPAILGDSASTSSSAVGVLGRISSASPGGFSAAVRGSNNGTGGNGIGVYGSQNGSGWGVYGTTPGGRGVYGSSNTGIGVYAQSAGLGTGAPALYAVNNDTSTNEPSGIAIFARNSSGDSTIVAQNTSANGDSFRALSNSGSVHFRVTSTGRVIARAVQITGGGDLAERFQTAPDQKVEPGTLLIIDETNPGQLKVSDQAYDTRVAGVVSGAGGVEPGLTLHQDGILEGDTVVAIAGRVYVKADARRVPIKAGDLLTTSDLPGHAMAASDRDRAYGAVIGKAMSSLDQGTGLVLVLVNLQ